MQVLLLLLTLTATVVNSCPVEELMSCVVQLNSQKVIFEMNIIDIIFNITTETALIHTCRTYERVFPCFDQRMSVCGTKPQKSILEKGKAVHNYLCAPYSLQRQQIFLNHSYCIQNVLKQPLNTKCDWHTRKFSNNLTSCRLSCKKGDALCFSKTDSSKDSICTFMFIENNCGADAALFYSQIQQVLTDREYPIQCSQSLKLVPLSLIKTDFSSKIKKGLTSKPLDLKNEVNPSKTFTSYITVYPHPISTISTNETASLWKSESNLSEFHSNNYTVTSNQSNSVTHATVTPSMLAIKLPISPTTKQKSSSSVSSNLHTLNYQIIHGARPIPDTLIHIPTMTPIARFKSNPYARSSPTIKGITVTPASLLTTQSTSLSSKMTINAINQESVPAKQWMPWYYARKKISPMLAPYYDAGKMITRSTPLLPTNTAQFQQIPEEIKQTNSLNSTQQSKHVFDFLFHLEPTTQPPNTQMNRINDSQVWEEQKADHIGSFSAVGPLFNQLKSHPLNLTELGNQANNYFSAAIKAISSAAQNSQNDPTLHNDPWRSIIDVMAPTIHRVSPDIIPRRCQEMERLEQT